MSVRCPGQDTRFWKPEDVFESPCPHCGAMVEFWKDEARRTCRACGKPAPNPRIETGCAKWCQFAEQCLGITREAARQAQERDGSTGDEPFLKKTEPKKEG